MTLKTNLRIIIIDDNQAIHEDFIKILSKNQAEQALNSLEEKLFDDSNESENIILPQFEIDTASQGQEGFERIKQAIAAGKPYALAFVDIRMPPGWDGIETIKHIWELDKDIQIVICTAYSDYSWEETIEQLGISDNFLILKKPFDNVAVRQLACALTKKWQLIQDSRCYTNFLEKNIKERTETLQQSFSMLHATLEASADGILVVNSDDVIVNYNQHYLEMWQIPLSVIENSNYKIVIEYILDKLQDPTAFLNKLEKFKNNPQEVDIDFVYLKDGRIFEQYSQPQKLEEQTVGRVWSFRDVTSRVSLEKKLEYQATHDLLTGLPNRVLLTDRMRIATAAANRSQNLFALLFLDLDRFKLVNDSFSHEAGDELLISVAKRFESSLREEDTISRLGGDEFIVIIPNLEKYEDVIPAATRLIKSLEKPFLISNHEINVSVSIGITLYPNDSSSINELLRNADLAMYKAKEKGGSQFQFYTNELNQKARIRWEKEHELRRALANNEFFLCYQPQIEINTKRMLSVEALIRWKHPKKGIIFPLEFIPIAEETGLIVPIGEWVFRTACKQNIAWQKQGLSPVRIAVNVTTLQFKQPGFVKMIKDILEETGLDPKYIEIELTESVIISGAENIRMINELKEIGVQIVLDDFGTGNSSLNYLRKLPIDRLKIDRSFIGNIDLNRSDEVIIQAIIAMARSLDLEVLAEGVETQNQLSFLKGQDCHNIQGYYYSKPLSLEEIENLMQKDKLSNA